MGFEETWASADRNSTRLRIRTALGRRSATLHQVNQDRPLIESSRVKNETSLLTRDQQPSCHEYGDSTPATGSAFVISLL